MPSPRPGPSRPQQRRRTAHRVVRTGLCALWWLSALAGQSAAAAEVVAPERTASASAAVALKPARKTTKSASAAAARRPVRHDREADLVTYGRRPDAMRLAGEIAAAADLDRQWVESQLAQARYVPAVARLIMPPPAGSAKNWAAYRARFVEPERIQAGVAFWTQHADWLARATQRYGVPPEIVVGIIGVETFYGRITGGYRVLDALATLSLDFPQGRSDRSAYFRDELAQLLQLSWREGIEPATIKGSYAGAIGLGQFMPGSINRYAVDFDEDRHVDMAGSPADVIGSVANYLAEHGWRPGLPAHFEVKPPLDTPERAALLVNDIVPSVTAQQMQERGAVLGEAGQRHDGLLALVELQNGSAAPSYVAGTQNFYTVTRYNWSAYYAMAVIDLGQAVAAARLAAR